MHVEHEPGLPQRLRAQPGDGRDIQALEHRIDGDALATGEPPREIDAGAVDQHEVHFRMRDADRLDCILDRRGALNA